MKKLSKLGCVCEKHNLVASEYRISRLGMDHTQNRNAEVSIFQCRLCQRIWLNYSVEYENYPNSSRWFKGIISKKEVTQLKPENAVFYLETLEWYIFGGLYFGNKENFGKGKLYLDN